MMELKKPVNTISSIFYTRKDIFKQLQGAREAVGQKKLTGSRR
jgi:hypothetical protein